MLWCNKNGSRSRPDVASFDNAGQKEAVATTQCRQSKNATAKLESRTGSPTPSGRAMLRSELTLGPSGSGEGLPSSIKLKIDLANLIGCLSLFGRQAFGECGHGAGGRLRQHFHPDSIHCFRNHHLFMNSTSPQVIAVFTRSVSKAAGGSGLDCGLWLVISLHLFWRRHRDFLSSSTGKAEQGCTADIIPRR